MGSIVGLQPAWLLVSLRSAPYRSCSALGGLLGCLGGAVRGCLKNLSR